MGTIANVLTGVAELGIRQPNDAIAEWTTADRHQGTYSIKLTKGGSGSAGGTGIKFCPPGITLGTWNTQVNTAPKYQFYFRNQITVGVANWVQWGFRFDDPNSNAHAEITVYPYHSIAGTNVWTLCDLGALAEGAGAAPAASYGANEAGTAVNLWGAGKLTDDIRDAIGNACVVSAVGSADDWVLSWVKINLWEAGIERYSYIDEIVVHGVSYSLEPGGDLPSLELESPFTEVGYTEDGVTLTYNADEADIEVEEETFAIDRVITKETLEITCNMAESSLYNIDKAMAGAVLSGNILTLGDGVNKTMNLRIAGITPAGFRREILIPLATAAGSVGMPYKKGTKTIVPVTFRALKGTGDAVQIINYTA